MTRRAVALGVFVVFVAAVFSRVDAQDRLRTMPGFDQFTKMSQQVQGGVVVSGAVTPTWAADGAQLHLHERRQDVSVRPGDDEGGRRGRGAGRGCRRWPRRAGAAAPPPAGGRGRGGLEQAQTEMPVAPAAGCPNTTAARGRQIDCTARPTAS